MSDRKIIPITQSERIRRTFWVSVPHDMEESRIQELFFEQDVGGSSHHGEKYQVDIDIDLEPGPMPGDVDPIEIDDD